MAQPATTEGRIAIVTAASSGIGLGAAQARWPRAAGGW